MGLRPLARVQKHRIAADAELKAMVDDLDSKGLTLDEINSQIVGAFGKNRVPSRSSLHRYMSSRRADKVKIASERAGMAAFMKQLEKAKTAYRNGGLCVAIGHLEQAIEDTRRKIEELRPVRRKVALNRASAKRSALDVRP